MLRAGGRRAGLLPAFAEIALAVGDVAAARGASDELSALAQGHGDGALGASAAGVRGAVELTEGDAAGALVSLRRAAETWRTLEAPYEVARARELLGLARRTLDDEDTAALELDAARTTYARLGAVPDLARLDSSARGARRETHGLTTRELEVLRLVAAGQTNKAIAASVVVSERTVDRHVSNILAKLRVSSRAAATASAYEHGLVRNLLGGITHGGPHQIEWFGSMRSGQGEPSLDRNGPCEGGNAMPNVSRETAAERIAFEGLDVRLEHLEGGYTVRFESHTADGDLAGLFRGAARRSRTAATLGIRGHGPDGLPFSGPRGDLRSGRRLNSVPPGHTPIHYAGAEIVEFSPTDILGETIPVVMRNLEAAGVTMHGS